jgi:hypothetical protein
MYKQKYYFIIPHFFTEVNHLPQAVTNVAAFPIPEIKNRPANKSQVEK